MKKVVVFLVLFIAIFAFNSCDNRASSGPKETSVDVLSPISYGNGVYYFPFKERAFAISLSRFIAHSVTDNLEIKAITGNGQSGYGCDLGYFVVVGNK